MMQRYRWLAHVSLASEKHNYENAINENRIHHIQLKKTSNNIISENSIKERGIFELNLYF